MLAMLLLLLLQGSKCRGNNIQIGDKLKVGDSWLSQDANFAIGFIESSNFPGMYNLSIWYNFKAAKAVVWTSIPNGGIEPQVVSRDAELSLQNVGLVVSDVKSKYTIVDCHRGCISATMMENGNFVVLRNDEENWETFRTPLASILLPGQQLQGKMKMAAGKYILSMSLNQLTMRYSDYNSFPYWEMKNDALQACLDDVGSTLYDPSCQRDPSLNLGEPVLNLTMDGILSFYASNGKAWNYAPGNSSIRYAVDYGTIKPRMLKLGEDGNLRMFSLSPEANGWDIVWQAILNGCDTFGVCGPFGICTYTMTCSCPPEFRPLDENDVSKGCTYIIPLTCNQAGFIQMTRVDFFYNDEQFVAQEMSLKECKTLCLNDCQCLAAAYKYEGSGLCFRKSGYQGKLYNGQQTPFQLNIAYIKVAGAGNNSVDDPYVTDVNATNTGSFTFHIQRSYFSRHLESILVVLVFAQLIVYSAIGYYAWWRLHHRLGRMWNQNIATDGAPTRFAYEELVIATKEFSQVIGSGAFGTVFKGMLPGNVIVAVKRLDIVTEGERQFKAEVRTIGRLRHMNLVQLFGYCVEGAHRLLVYEYMPNSSLEKVIRQSTAVQAHCNWKKRFEIALGIARALAYLHEECVDCVLHCDVKPQNVLLDENLCPKVADFGLAKLISREQHAAVVTTVRGTRGYLAPEWLRKSTITSKVDVYSYGMVLLEILSGSRTLVDTPSAQDAGLWYFPLWAYQKLIANNFHTVVDPSIQDDVDWVQFERLLRLSFWCIQFDPTNRPTMSRVVQMIEGTVQVPPPPPIKHLEKDSFIDSPEVRPTIYSSIDAR